MKFIPIDKIGIVVMITTANVARCQDPKLTENDYIKMIHKCRKNKTTHNEVTIIINKFLLDYSLCMNETYKPTYVFFEAAFEYYIGMKVENMAWKLFKWMVTSNDIKAAIMSFLSLHSDYKSPHVDEIICSSTSVEEFCSFSISLNDIGE